MDILRQTGMLNSNLLHDSIQAGHVVNADPKNIRPASLDLRISHEIYRINDIALPNQGEPVRHLLSLIGARKHSYSQPLEKNISYLVRLEEELFLPKGVHAIFNPRSSTGRNDILIRVLADGVSRFDFIPDIEYQGSVWAIITPKSYPILLTLHQTLCQLRLSYGHSLLSQFELAMHHKTQPLVWIDKHPIPSHIMQSHFIDQDSSVLLTLNLEGEIWGWESIGSSSILDFESHNNATHDFFRPIYPSNKGLILRKNFFYILKTAESVRVPLNLACEMTPMDERSGEFRTHYAGFIDPGWGYGKQGENHGRALVLEIRPFEDMLVRHKQAIGKIRFHHMLESAPQSYDSLSVSNYSQGFDAPKLSRHFITK